MILHKRHRDWATRLDKFIQERSEEPFKRGKHDCCMFACDAVRAMTGSDPGRWFRRRYSNRKEAVRVLRLFAGTLENVVEKIAEWDKYEEVPIFKAQRGDIVLMKMPNYENYALGIVDLTGTKVLSVSEEKGFGLVSFDLDSDMRAWRV